jgi:hypothetical protein
VSDQELGVEPVERWTFRVGKAVGLRGETDLGKDRGERPLDGGRTDVGAIRDRQGGTDHRAVVGNRALRALERLLARAAAHRRGFRRGRGGLAAIARPVREAPDEKEDEKHPGAPRGALRPLPVDGHRAVNFTGSTRSTRNPDTSLYPGTGTPCVPGRSRAPGNADFPDRIRFGMVSLSVQLASGVRYFSERAAASSGGPPLFRIRPGNARWFPEPERG